MMFSPEVVHLVLAWERYQAAIKGEVERQVPDRKASSVLLDFARLAFVAGWIARGERDGAQRPAPGEDQEKPREPAPPQRDPVSWNPFRPRGLRDDRQMLTIECHLPPGRGRSVRGLVPFDVVLRYAVDREVLAHVLGQAVVDGVLLRLRGMDQ